MAFDLRFRPLNGFPKPLRPVSSRKARPFRLDFYSVRIDLLNELDKLGAVEAEINVAVRGDQIRRDGTMPLAGAAAAHPGVVLWANTRLHGELSWACDTCARWEDNVRAISLTLERLRLADLYDVMAGAQYRGFAALPESASVHQLTTRESAILFLAVTIGASQEVVRADPAKAVRTAQRITHPDVGGDREKFQLVMQAKEILGA